MLNQVHFQIVGKVAENITASRINPKVPPYRPIHPLLSSVTASTPTQPSLTALLAEVEGKYNLKQKLLAKAHSSKNYHHAFLQVVFSLAQKTNSIKRVLEIWTINATLKNNYSLKGEVTMVRELFEDIADTLETLPLFRIILRDKEHRTRHSLSHKFFFQPPKDFYPPPELRCHNLIMKQSQALSISIAVDFNPHFLASSSWRSKQDSEKRKVSTTSSEEIVDRNVSVYAFYDKELDLTFLSSDQQNFKEGESEEIKVQCSSFEQPEEEYQLLISPDHHEFLEENYEAFDYLIQKQLEYMQK